MASWLETLNIWFLSFMQEEHYQYLLHSRHVCLTLCCPLVDVLVNIHANVKDAWKCVSSDSNIIEHKWAFTHLNKLCLELKHE